MLTEVDGSLIKTIPMHLMQYCKGQKAFTLTVGPASRMTHPTSLLLMLCLYKLWYALHASSGNRTAELIGRMENNKTPKQEYKSTEKRISGRPLKRHHQTVAT